MARFVNPTAYAKCLSLMKECSSLKELNQIYAQLHMLGLHRDGFVADEIIRFCALSPVGNLSYAESVLRRAITPTLSSWNNVIRGYSKSDLPKNAILVYMAMRDRGTKPDKLTFPFLVKASSRLSALQEGRQIQVEILKHGLSTDVYVQNTLIHFYGCCRQVSDARQVFDEMSFRTVVSWNSIMKVCIENLKIDDAFAIFAKMRMCGIEPDETTLLVLLSACAEVGNLSLGKWVHCQVIEKGIMVNCQLGTALVDMYAKCGVLDFARSLFDRMVEKNVQTWTAMILGYAQHGSANEGLELFMKMKNSSIQPNYVTFLGVLCACSHAGLAEDGYKYFQEMVNVYGIQPVMAHYGAMVDILGRSGRLTEAYDFIMKMPFEPDPVILRTLLSACSIHDVSGKSEISQKVAKRLIELEPRRSGNLVMVANMYADGGLWKEAGIVRTAMRERGLKKMAGESCIEVCGSIHRFLSGDDSSSDYDNMRHLLHGLNLNMKMIVTVPFDSPLENLD